jgi:hypothetical protein
MNNNVRDTRHPAQQISGPNKYLNIAKLSKSVMAIYFNDGDHIPACVLLEFDTLNLLVKSIDMTGEKPDEEMVITRSSIKKIVTTAEDNYKRSTKQ